MLSENKRKYKKKKKKKFHIIPILLLIFFITACIGISVFFKISSITVSGSEVYTPDEIISASGIKIGENLVTLKNSEIASSIKNKLPFVYSVTFIKRYPSTLDIQIVESIAIAKIENAQGECWKIDKSGRALEEAETNDKLITIDGISAEKTLPGKKIEVSSENSLTLGYLLDVLETISNVGEVKNVGKIDVTDPGNITFTYMDTFNVEIGSSNDIENKMSLVISIANKIGTEKHGRIIVKNENEPSFVPEK